MRGQISLDLILAITIGFFVVGAVIAVSAQIGKMQTEASIRQQLNDIGNGVAAVISNSAVFNDATTANIYFDIPFLLVPGEETAQPCNITINNGDLVLSYNVFDLETGISSEIKVTKYYYVKPTDPMNIPGSAKCGERLAITKP